MGDFLLSWGSEGGEVLGWGAGGFGVLSLNGLVPFLDDGGVGDCDGCVDGWFHDLVTVIISISRRQMVDVAT
jgi:hypothetical protein